MSKAQALLETALKRLTTRPGFVNRPDQAQLALLIGDLIEGRRTGAFEAPTGLGKSLAALLPAIAHGIAENRRIAIATYTNILAEQYWKKDLPLALNLFDVPPEFKASFLVGRQRYACLAELENLGGSIANEFQALAELGIETEWRTLGFVPKGQLTRSWIRCQVPPVCAGRLCHRYDDCFYFNARKSAQKANLIITNHSLILQDGIGADHMPDTPSLLGPLDFIILDEAHDLVQAANGALEFEINPNRLAMMAGLATRVEQQLSVRAGSKGARALTEFRRELETASNELGRISQDIDAAIVSVLPTELTMNPGVTQMQRGPEASQSIAIQVAEATTAYTDSVSKLLVELAEDYGEGHARFEEAIMPYVRHLDEFAQSAATLFHPSTASVTQVNIRDNATIRRDILDAAPHLKRYVFDRVPHAAMSATLTLDENFDYFKRISGISPDYTEILPSPFDYSRQAAIYLPRPDQIPDPSVARREGHLDSYHAALAREIRNIIELLSGRTLVLFASRREMEAVADICNLPDDLPLLVQPKTNAGRVGEQFKKNPFASLFALRSFWTGFDAPGETLSCVAIVRLPFEVPFEPVSVSRAAYLQNQGHDPFWGHSLPSTTMLMRQGVGRLIRTADDRGIIAILDPRIRTKSYGEVIISGLPKELKTFDDFADAAGWLGLGD